LLEVEVPENGIEFRGETVPDFLLSRNHEFFLIEIFKLEFINFFSCLNTLLQVHIEDRFEKVHFVSEFLL
jgi:hypothetical protein